jgi:hypothetical protein
VAEPIFYRKDDDAWRWKMNRYRHDIDGELQLDPDGDWVLYEDVEQRAADNYEELAREYLDGSVLKPDSPSHDYSMRVHAAAFRWLDEKRAKEPKRSHDVDEFYVERSEL